MIGLRGSKNSPGTVLGGFSVSALFILWLVSLSFLLSCFCVVILGSKWINDVRRQDYKNIFCFSLKISVLVKNLVPLKTRLPTNFAYTFFLEQLKNLNYHFFARIALCRNNRGISNFARVLLDYATWTSFERSNGNVLFKSWFMVLPTTTKIRRGWHNRLSDMNN